MGLATRAATRRWQAADGTQGMLQEQHAPAREPDQDTLFLGHLTDPQSGMAVEGVEDPAGLLHSLQLSPRDQPGLSRPPHALPDGVRIGGGDEVSGSALSPAWRNPSRVRLGFHECADLR